MVTEYQHGHNLLSPGAFFPNKEPQAKYSKREDITEARNGRRKRIGMVGVDFKGTLRRPEAIRADWEALVEGISDFDGFSRRKERDRLQSVQVV